MEVLSASARGEVGPVFEGFAVGTTATADPAAVVAVVAEVLGHDWHVSPIGSSTVDFDVTRQEQSPSASEAWEMAYRLRSHPAISYAEPLFAVAVYEDPRSRAADGPGPFEAAESVTTHLPESDHPEWNLEMIRATEAWDRFFGGDPMRAGAGVVIGHPDTGYQVHPEIIENLLIDRGYDFVRNDTDPRDDLKKSLRVVLDNPSHGTQTASVIISPRGPRASYIQEDGTPEDPSGKAVSGVAPGARLIPIRTSRTVALTSMRGLVRAIHHAVDHGAHLISISMGGVPSQALERAVRYAEREGVIVCAAAGNQVRFVVWPAVYEEVVATAACNAVKRPWKGSSRGSRVTVTAPGESVWRAHVELYRAEEERIVPHVGRGSGTSYAVAHVAGLAALWLSRHGRDRLVASYGKENLPPLFRQILRQSCLDAGLGHGFGAGLVDAVALLEAPLPPVIAFEAAPSPILEAAAVSGAGRGMQNVAALFDIDVRSEAPGSASPFESLTDRRADRLSALLCRILNTPAERLAERIEDVGDELIFHLMSTPEAYDALGDALSRPPGLEAAVVEPESARDRLLSRDLSGRLRTVLSLQGSELRIEN